MIDQKTLAYINMYAILGALENLCELAPEAPSLLTNKKPIRIGFEVKGGPSATLTFKNGKCRMENDGWPPPGQCGVGSQHDKADWKTIIPALAADGTQWLVVKPTVHPDSLADLEKSIVYLKGMMK